MMAFLRMWAASTCLLLALATTGALAAPLQVSLSDNPTTCQPMTVTWDTSAGTAPWTVTVAPLGHVPVSASLPANYMSGNAWHWNWNVPGYPNAVSQVIVAVSDSTGRVSGTSAFSRLAKAGTCSAPAEHLDFIWYPPASGPKQCEDWLITVQEDRGNLGLKWPVELLILPENDVPTTLRITDQRHSNVDWTVNYPRGTNFAIASFDAGTSGTGGVGGSVYTVGRGRAASCIGSAQKEAVLGLPAASSTASPATPTTTAAPRMATSRLPSTGTATHSKAAPSTTAAAKTDATAEKSSSSTGVIGGAVGGVLGAFAIVGLAVFFYRKHHNNKGPDEYGVYANNEKRSFFGGFGSGRSADRFGYSNRGADAPRFGASTDQQGGISPFVTGRASPWRWSARPVGLSDNQDMAQAAEDRNAILGRFNDGPSSMGHSSSISLHRGSDSIGGSVGIIALKGAPSVHSVVPDDALFPPPMPTNRAMMPNQTAYAAYPPASVGPGVGAGVGAGIGAVGMKQAWNRDRSDSGSSQRDPFRNPAAGPTTPPKERAAPAQYQQPMQDAGWSRQHPASRDSMAAIAGLPLSPSSAGGATRSRDLTGVAAADPFNASQERIPEQDLSTMRIPPPAPVSTSLFDPYTHASRLYSQDDVAHISAALARDNAATPNSLTSDTSAPRYVDPKESAARFRTLETQLLNDRKKVVSNIYDDPDSDDEGGLPYMS